MDVYGFATRSELLNESNGLIDLIVRWGSVINHGYVQLLNTEFLISLNRPTVLVAGVNDSANTCRN